MLATCRSSMASIASDRMRLLHQARKVVSSYPQLLGASASRDPPADLVVAATPVADLCRQSNTFDVR